MQKEGKFKTWFIKQLEARYPGCIVFLMDANYRQGSPDVFMVWGDRWAAFEVKQYETASRRPNQQYYISILNEMSFAAFVYPENVEEVLDALYRAFSR